MSELTPKQKQIVDELLEGKTLAQQKATSEMLGVPFEWPTIEQQVVGKGEKKGVKRGRAKYERDMYTIPGFEIEGFNPFPGFVCHPAMAVAAAHELLRLAREDGLLKD